MAELEALDFSSEVEVSSEATRKAKRPRKKKKTEDLSGSASAHDLTEPCNRMRMRCDMGFISSQGESLPPQDGMTGESLHPGSHSIL